jgi:hypothetical protein
MSFDVASRNYPQTVIRYLGKKIVMSKPKLIQQNKNKILPLLDCDTEQK